jgi:hypothetical protein
VNRISATVACAACAAIVSGACHVTTRYQDTRRGETRREAVEGAAPRALPPSMEVSEDGRFRFVEPYVCQMVTVTELATFDVERTRPNVATLVIGVIAASLGGVATAAGLSGDDPSGSPLPYAGVAGLAVGVPFVIGPLIGNSTARVPTDMKELRAPSGEDDCGTKPLPGKRATVSWSGLRVVGSIDADGYFGVSPFAFVDAFDVGQIPAMVLQIEIEQEGGKLPMEIVLDAAALAGAREGYFKSINIDPTIEELRKVPRLHAGALRVSRVRRDDERGVRLALPLVNDGPGDAYGVRLSVNTPNPEIDGRYIYVGHVPPKTSLEIDTVIPISDEADRTLSADEIEIAVIVRDAHQTASDAPVRFRGRVLPDPSR